MKKAILATIFVACVSSIAMAQTGGDTKQSPPVVGSVQLGVDVTTLDWVAVGYRASKLLKADIYNEEDKKIGKVQDLIIKPDGTINVAVLEVGGFLGMGKHEVAIPVHQFTNDGKKIVLPGATKDSLKALPEFKYAKK